MNSTINRHQFIAWHPTTKQMSKPFNPFVDNLIWFHENQEDFCVVSDATDNDLQLYQCTGKPDRTGQPIFEGHLLSNNFGTLKEVIRVVEFQNGSYVAKVVKGKSKLPKFVILGEEYHFAIVGHLCMEEKYDLI